MAKVVVLGLGEAGALYARGLRERGFDVVGYDPFVRLDEPGIEQAETIAAAVEGAELVLSLVGARAAEAVAREVFGAAVEGTVYADLNTAAPDLKTALEREAAGAGIAFADIAVLAPVPRAGAATPLMASGTGAERFARIMAHAGAEIDVIPGPAGDAAARKLIRSAFMKGLAAVVIESVGAAQKAGCEPWLRGQIANELAGDPDALLDRLIDGSRQHAGRRVHELADTRAYLESIGQPTRVVDAAHSWLASFLDDQPAR